MSIKRIGRNDMGLMNGLMGNATEVDNKTIEKEILPLIADGEVIQNAYKLIRDLFVFTDKLLILVDKQGMTGKKVEYHSIPYKSITHFAVETAGHFDLDAELKIWMSGMSTPITKEFRKDKSIYDVQKALTNYICR